MAVRPGQMLDGKYRVELVLGQGGMGYVVSAWHMQLDERVAIKLLLPEALAQRAFVARFQREARAAVKIKSEHVCRVLDVGQSAEHGPFMVMEHLEGEDLGSRARRLGPLPVADAATYLVQACHALGEAHGRGIVHRDLKPSNLFLAKRPDGAPIIKVLDFGISKLVDAQSGAMEQSLTTTSMFVGSYAYMSPEQARDARQVDRRADVWALGVVLQKLLTGRTPFVADNPAAYVAKIVADPPRPLRQGHPEIPPELSRIVLRCLQKKPDDRYANVGEFALALRPFAPGTEQLVDAVARLCQTQIDGPRPSEPLGSSLSAPSDDTRPALPRALVDEATTPLGSEPARGGAPTASLAGPQPRFLPSPMAARAGSSPSAAQGPLPVAATPVAAAAPLSAGMPHPATAPLPHATPLPASTPLPAAAPSGPSAVGMPADVSVAAWAPAAQPRAAEPSSRPVVIALVAATLIGASAVALLLVATGDRDAEAPETPAATAQEGPDGPTEPTSELQTEERSSTASVDTASAESSPEAEQSEAPDPDAGAGGSAGGAASAAGTAAPPSATANQARPKPKWDPFARP